MGSKPPPVSFSFISFLTFIKFYKLPTETPARKTTKNVILTAKKRVGRPKTTWFTNIINYIEENSSDIKNTNLKNLVTIISTRKVGIQLLAA